MKTVFEKMNPSKYAKLGGLVFDEVIIKEGLVFDSKNFEIIDFTDLQEDVPSDEKVNQPTDNLATHAHQMFFRTLVLITCVRISSLKK